MDITVSPALMSAICPQAHNHALASFQLIPVLSLPAHSLFHLQNMSPFRPHPPVFSRHNPSHPQILKVSLTSPDIQTRSGHSTLVSAFTTLSTVRVNHWLKARLCQRIVKLEMGRDKVFVLFPPVFPASRGCTQ